MLARHALLESQKEGISQHLKSINRRAQQFIRLPSADSSRTSTQSNTPTSSLSPNTSLNEASSTKSLLPLSESQLVREKLDALNKAFDLINVLGGERRRYLEERREFHKFIEEAEEESLWLNEKLQLVKSTEAGHDLSSTQILINKHEQLEDELKFRKSRMDKLVQNGEKLIASKRYNSKENEKLSQKYSQLQNLYAELVKATANRRTLLEDSYSSQQYYTDADSAETWIKDKMALVALGGDHGKDEASAQTLLQRHTRAQEEIKAYEQEVKRLDEISNVLIGNLRFNSLSADLRAKLIKNQNKTPIQSSDFDESEDQDSENNIDSSNQTNQEVLKI